ncbi:MAG: 5-(carboxyamino)imidazole ribonucleotide synthase [Alcaligenaceae bacterium]|nr:MAG: 5-(carboxyamino)imidazole ribonucleotide synthase [Alcaligenaceae bacterium]
MIVPGEWLGLMGGGQLGRMFCQAAQSLGYRVAVLDPAPEGPAASVADMHIQAAYDDEEGLLRLSRQCRAVTTEFENVPATSLKILAKHCRVTPGAQVVEVVQDRIAEKAYIASQGVAVAPYAPIRCAADLYAVGKHLFPGILKVARLGYDGKGQARVSTCAQAVAAFEEFGAVPCVLEAMLDLQEELSVVMARGLDGQCKVFPVASNVHDHGILAMSTVDSQPAALAQLATEAALAIANGLQYQGVLCVEFFILRDGQLLVNEIAPRPHNSGHYTMNACVTSQFEQQARVMARLPLGSTQLLAPVVMLNILGDVWYTDETDTQTEPDWSGVLAVAGASLHLYGKREARRGRKMGHVNCVGNTLSEAIASANQIVNVLRLPVAA